MGSEMCIRDRAPGAEAFLPTSFNDVERIHRSDSSVINPSNNDAIFNASAAANAKAAQDVAALNAARVSALNAAQAHRISEASLQKQAAPTVSPSLAVTNIFESGSSPKVEKLLSEISEVKFLLQSHVAGNFWGSIQQENTHVTEIVKHLLNSGFSPKLCAEIARNLPEDLSLPALIKNAREQVKCMIKTSHAFDIFDRGGVFAFIGPTGVGKTATVAKITCYMRLQ